MTLPAEYTTLAAILIFLAFFAAGARWAWTEIKTQNDKDRAWREAQNLKREIHEEKQNADWRSAVMDMDKRREENERIRQAAIEHLAEAVNGVSADLKIHHTQAATILTIAERIDTNTRPPGNGKQQNGGRM